MSDAPEPTPASRDEGFAAWLAMNEYLVEEDFLVFDVQGMPNNPFSEYTLTIPTMVTSALARRTGDEWAFVYRCQREDRDAASHD